MKGHGSRADSLYSRGPNHTNASLLVEIAACQSVLCRIIEIISRTSSVLLGPALYL